jgi:hypothetical protein
MGIPQKNPICHWNQVITFKVFSKSDYVQIASCKFSSLLWNVIPLGDFGSWYMIYNGSSFQYVHFFSFRLAIISPNAYIKDKGDA